MSSKHGMLCILQYNGYKCIFSPLSWIAVEGKLLSPHEKRTKSQWPALQSPWRQAAVNTTRSFFHISTWGFVIQHQAWCQWINIRNVLMISVENCKYITSVFTWQVLGHNLHEITVYAPSKYPYLAPPPFISKIVSPSPRETPGPDEATSWHSLPSLGASRTG